jgi:streptomycin 6-kinase
VSDLGPVDPGRAGEAAWLRRWLLRPEGDPVTTSTSTIVPVLTEEGEPAILKVAHTGEEVRGADLLVALDGHGVARVLRRQRSALLVERAMGSGDLIAMAERDPDDDTATRIICEVAGIIHAASDAVLTGEETPTLIELPTWFQHLFEHADRLGPFHRHAAEIASALFEDPREPVVLHGDLHHGNVLDFGERGWLAIDPKGLFGEAGFDYANLLCNPSPERALQPGRLERQLGVVVETTELPRDRLVQWLVAWSALSSTWFTIDENPRLAESAAAIGELALTLGSE